jgi:hypothetical protein
MTAQLSSVAAVENPDEFWHNETESEAAQKKGTFAAHTTSPSTLTLSGPASPTEPWPESRAGSDGISS